MRRWQFVKFTDCMPSGRFICPISPAIRKGKWKKKEDEKMRNEGCAAAGRQNVLNKYDIIILISAVPVRRLQFWKFTFCMPSGSTILSTAPAGGKAKRRKREK